MNQSVLIAGFDREEDLLQATKEVRRHGCQIVDAYTPCPVHGLEKAMGLKDSRLPWICFLCGVAGAILAFWFQYWTHTINWPINVGGRPESAWLAYVPIAFEVMVLMAGFGVVIAFLLRCCLFPGKKPVMPTNEVTDGSFVLVLQPGGGALAPDQLRRLLNANNSTFFLER